MDPLTCLRSDGRSRIVRGATPWLILACLLLKSAVPMLAAAAAQLRGVGVADVCPVYGVATLPAPPHTAMGGHVAMAAMGGRVDIAMGTDLARHKAGHGGAGLHADGGQQDGTGPHDGHGHHGDIAAGHDQCVLTPLLGAAPLAAALAAAVGVANRAEPRRAPTAVAAPLHDEVLAWYARDAHPPPG